MNKIWFSSDLHFGHQKDFLWGPRGFYSSEEHDEEVLENFKRVIDKNDDVYILGDLMLGDNKEGWYKIAQIPGKLHIILGNHDTATRATLYEALPNVVEVVYATQIKYKKYSFYLSHYPTYMGNYDEQMSKIWCLHGHTHDSKKFSDIDKNYNVALDAHGNHPVEIEDVLLAIQNKWNKIYKERNVNNERN